VLGLAEMRFGQTCFRASVVDPRKRTSPLPQIWNSNPG